MAEQDYVAAGAAWVERDGEAWTAAIELRATGATREEAAANAVKFAATEWPDPHEWAERKPEDLEAELSALREQVERIKGYAQHTPMCQLNCGTFISEGEFSDGAIRSFKIRKRQPSDAPPACTCGLDALLDPPVGEHR